MKSLKGIACVLAFAAPFGACAQTKLTLAHAFAADFIPAFVAKDKGIFAKHGLDVTLQPFTNIAIVPAALMSNQIQVGATTPTNLLAAAEAGLDVVGICGSSRLQKANPLISLVTRPGLTVTRADDLRGKRVGVPGFNAIIDLFFRKWLLNNKVPLKEVTIVEALLPQMPDMLKAGHVDAVTPIEPFVTRIVANGLGSKSIDFYSEVNPDVIAAFWIARREWADGNRKAAQEFCASYREAIDWSLKNPQEAHQIEAKYLMFSLKGFPTWNTSLEPRDLEFVQALMRELGVLRKPLDLNKVVWK